MNRAAIAIVAVSAIVQIAIATMPDTMGDLLMYRSWVRALAHDGLAAAYWPSPGPPSPDYGLPIDYPPLLPYVFYVLGHAVEAISPAALGSDRLLDFLIRAPLILANLLLALLVFIEVRRFAPDAAHLALAVAALNPALIFDTAYWGQADAPCALLVATSVVAMVRGRPEWSWAAITAAALVKPLAYPLVPLLAFETGRRFGGHRMLRGAATAVVTLCVVLLPFLGVGRFFDALKSLVTQVDAMPYISVNAHNVWWLVGRGTPWTDAHERPLGLLPWSVISVVLFGTLYIAVLVLLARSREARSLYVAAATVSFGFFVLSTHMHENHLFITLPLMALAGAESKGLRVAVCVLSATMLANMMLHDPLLTHWARALTPGPTLLLPQVPAPPADLLRRFTDLGYPWIASQMRGETTVIGSLATMANAQVVVLALFAWMAALLRARSFDPLLTAREWSLPGRFWLLGFILVVGSALPFVDHVRHYGKEHELLIRFGRGPDVRNLPRTGW